MRIREIKPAFWVNDQLADCSRDARLMFIGLWMIADRAGFFTDRPRKIRAELFPYEPDADVAGWLRELAGAGFIVKHATDDGDVWQIVNFERHQRPHVKERDSKFKHLAPKSRDFSGKAGENPGKPGKAGEKRPAPSAPMGDGYMGDGGLGEGGDGADAPKEKPPKSKPKRSRRCPNDFALTDDLRRFATEAGIPGSKVAAVFAEFHDHEFAAPRSDWPATWRNWCRRAAERMPKAADPYAHLPRAPLQVVKP